MTSAAQQSTHINHTENGCNCAAGGREINADADCEAALRVMRVWQRLMAAVGEHAGPPIRGRLALQLRLLMQVGVKGSHRRVTASVFIPQASIELLIKMTP